ncbi:response regulator [bacterium]|nr:response regulator [bacterium]
MIHIIIVDQVRLILESISAALDGEPDISILGVTSGKEEALSLLATCERACDVVLVSADLPEDDALTLVRKCINLERPPRVLVMGVPEAEPVIMTFIEAGAAGYILKEDTVAHLLQNIRAAYNGEAIISPEIAMSLMERVNQLADRVVDFDAGYYSSLTRREREILELLAQDLTNQEIADHLFIELGTVKNHVHHILDKLNVNSRQDASSYLHLVQKHNAVIEIEPDEQDQAADVRE